MKSYLIFSFSLIICSIGSAQKQPDSLTAKTVDSINSLLDQSVVGKKIDVLKKHYAHDFIFTHGTGLVDSKESWIKNVADTSVHFVSRKHDSVHVELHNSIAILYGKLTVQRQQPDKVAAYALRYIRVYAFRTKVWQLISHRTTAEWHLN